MDLTHETYVHAGSIGDEAITSTPFDVTHTDRTATVTRWMRTSTRRRSGRSSSASRAIMSTGGRSSTSRRRPWSWATSVSRRRDGRAAGRPFAGRNGCFLAAITPESETTCHYFWNFVATFKTDDENSRATSNARTSTTARASTTRTRRFWRRSRRRSTRIRACPSTISTSTPAHSGRAGMIDRMLARASRRAYAEPRKPLSSAPMR